MSVAFVNNPNPHFPYGPCMPTVKTGINHLKQLEVKVKTPQFLRLIIILLKVFANKLLLLAKLALFSEKEEKIKLILCQF